MEILEHLELLSDDSSESRIPRAGNKFVAHPQPDEELLDSYSRAVAAEDGRHIQPQLWILR